MWMVQNQSLGDLGRKNENLDNYCAKKQICFRSLAVPKAEAPRTPCEMHPNCISQERNSKETLSSTLCAESHSELSDFMLIQSYLRGQRDYSHSNEAASGRLVSALAVTL